MNNRSRGNNRSGYQQNDSKPKYDLMVVHDARLPMPKQELLAPFGIGQIEWQALTDAVFPSAKSVAGVMLALSICKARKLDVFKKVVHIVPMYSSKHGCEIETIWPGIAEARITATRTGQYAGRDGVKWGRVIRRAFRAEKSGQGQNGPYSTTVSCPEMEFPETAQVTVYKIIGGVRCPFVGPEVSFVEMFSGQKGMRVPNDRWQQAPRQMLEKCAEAAALRAAFPEELGGEWFAEEMEGKTMHGDIEGRGAIIDHEPQQQQAEQQGEVQDGEFENVDDDDQGGEPEFWNADQVAGFKEYIEKGVAACKSIKRLDRAHAAEEQNLEKLTAEDRLMIERLFEKRRQELSPSNDKGASETDSNPDRADTDAGGEQQQAEQQEKPREASNPAEPPFLRNLRRDLDEAETQDEVSAVYGAVKRQLEGETPAIVAQADKLISDRREAIRNVD